MIAARLNLVCAKGHRHYAPPREIVAWIGHECLHGAAMRTDGFPKAGRCQELLRPNVLPHWLDAEWLDAVAHRWEYRAT